MAHGLSFLSSVLFLAFVSFELKHLLVLLREQSLHREELAMELVKSIINETLVQDCLFSTP